jgi:hypothetical protein
MDLGFIILSSEEPLEHLLINVPTKKGSAVQLETAHEFEQ